MKKKAIIGGIFLFLGIIFCVKQFKTDIKMNSNNSAELAIYLNDEKVDNIPTKESGYYFDLEKSNCSDGAKINWNSITWSPEVKNISATRTKCNLYFTTTYTEGILNGTDPVIKNDLVPVTLDNDGTVRKADLNSKWYSYENQEWANSVILQNNYDSLNKQGKVNGATKNDGYVSFDGVDDYIDLGLANYDFGNTITIFATFSLPKIPGEIQKVISNAESAGFSLEFTNGYIQASIYINGIWKMIKGTTKIETNQIYKVAASYDGNLTKLYVNGVLEAEKNVTGNITTSLAPMVLSANPNKDGTVTSEFLNMNLFGIQLYNRALSEEEIKNNMSEEIKVTDSTGLLRYVDFTNKEYQAKEIIPEEVIESYFVWIPRYKYKIFNEGNYTNRTEIDTSKVQTIDVKFESKDTPASTGSTIGTWLTHPAFTSFGTNGMWVGKFETGKSFGNDNVRDANQIQIKPNISSWRSIQVANAFYSSYDYKRELDSHMMKNTEWGAVAYLSHSAYGSRQSVRINNNSNYITGYSATNEPTCGYTATNETCNVYCNNGTCNKPYNTETGYLASTTGNITGVYDMAGGTWEYVMGIMLDESGNPMSGRNNMYNSGFNGTLGCPTCDADTSGITSVTNGYAWPERKYYDTYPFSASTEQFGRRILGDATGEVGPFGTATYLTQTRAMGSWYTNIAEFIATGAPWFFRSSAHNYGLSSGIFVFSNAYGNLAGHVSFRIVLTP